MSEISISQVVFEVMSPFSEDAPTTSGVRSMRFDAGDGSQYWVVAPLVDSSSELRSKTIRAVHATGRFTNASFTLYGYDVGTGIDLDTLESGTSPSVGPIPITDSVLVTQSARTQVNLPNAVLHTVRLEGSDIGQAVRDEIHEIVYEISQSGVRR